MSLADPAQLSNQLNHLRSQVKAEGPSTVLLEQLVQAVPAPDASLFADVGEAPTRPPPGAQAVAAAWAATTAQHLQLTAELVGSLGAEELGLNALGAEGSAAPLPGPAGSIRIEELDAEAPTSRLAAVEVLAASLYGADCRLQRPWATAQLAEAAHQLLQVLAAKLADVLGSQQASRQQAAGALLQEVSTARSGGGGGSHGQAQQQAAEVQQLLALAAPAAVQQLRPVLAAKVEHGRHSTMRLEPYTGPGNFERCLAAGQLAWLVRQLGGRHLGAATSTVLPLLLVAIEDSFPPVQACGLWALQHLAAAGQAADLRPHGQLALGAATRALASGSDASWPAAAAAAVAVACRLEGGSPYSHAYHDVLTVLLDEGERGAHSPDRAETWLAAVLPLFSRLGLQLAAHSARLLPLLLGWCLAARQAVRAAALEALLHVVRLTWPHVGVHALLLWQVLRRVHEEELQCRLPLAVGSGGSNPAEASRAVAERAEDCGLALWFAAGTDFQVQLMTAKVAPKDELLQAVMQRLEETAEADWMEAEAAAGLEQQQPPPQQQLHLAT